VRPAGFGAKITEIRMWQFRGNRARELRLRACTPQFKVMAKSSEEYRSDGLRIRALAETMSAPGVRETLLEVAARYDEMARQADLLQSELVASQTPQEQ